MVDVGPRRRLVSLSSGPRPACLAGRRAAAAALSLVGRVLRRGGGEARPSARRHWGGGAPPPSADGGGSGDSPAPTSAGAAAARLPPEHRPRDPSDPGTHPAPGAGAGSGSARLPHGPLRRIEIRVGPGRPPLHWGRAAAGAVGPVRRVARTSRSPTATGFRLAAACRGSRSAVGARQPPFSARGDRAPWALRAHPPPPPACAAVLLEPGRPLRAAAHARLRHLRRQLLPGPSPIRACAHARATPPHTLYRLRHLR
jgi:hypothetical protein